MLEEVMVHIKYFFPTELSEEAEYTITEGTISLQFVSNGQYIRIEGSTMNDGVYKYPVTGLTNETFKGVITVLAPPKSFLDLVDEISTYNATYKATPYQSESFGGYSYSKTSVGSGSGSWCDAFRSKLNVWRKI